MALRKRNAEIRNRDFLKKKLRFGLAVEFHFRK